MTMDSSPPDSTRREQFVHALEDAGRREDRSQGIWTALAWLVAMVVALGVLAGVVAYVAARLSTERPRAHPETACHARGPEVRHG
jgi:hypothetical protein